VRLWDDLLAHLDEGVELLRRDKILVQDIGAPVVTAGEIGDRFIHQRIAGRNPGRSLRSGYRLGEPAGALGAFGPDLCGIDFARNGGEKSASARRRQAL
jgi:hypothetical protein